METHFYLLTKKWRQSKDHCLSNLRVKGLVKGETEGCDSWHATLTFQKALGGHLIQFLHAKHSN